MPDTSVIIDGRVSELINDGTYTDVTVLIPEAVVAELEALANESDDAGWSGLTELQALTDLSDADEIGLRYVGRRPSEQEQRGASAGKIDALIRDVAEDNEAVILTSDVVQSEVAKAKGLQVEYVDPKIREYGSLPIESFFDEETMSVHLKTGVVPMAKRGSVGEMYFEPIGDSPVTEDSLQEWTREILSLAKASPDGFLELDEDGMQIVQYENYRIAIARPPFADGWEITAVRPIVEMDLEDYEHAEELKERLIGRQRGVLIAGSPGAGKTTFAQAVAEFLNDHGFSVKTMEKPRDLQVGPEITQYTALDDQMEKTADSLLMVRPDYTIYDEVRKTNDFMVFADMRLAGVGMIGVVHATRAIDALQRLIGRVELGLIPQIVDTVVYIEAGEVAKVYDVTTVVKVPQGLMEQDLARPVIEIRDFETGIPEYEIYTFNRQIVTVPLDEQPAKESSVDRLAGQEVEREIRSIASGPVSVEFTGNDRAIVYVSEDDVSRVIGRGGGRIEEIENNLGISIDVRTLDEQPTQDSSPDRQEHSGNTVVPEMNSQHVIIPVEGHMGETVEVLANGEYLFTATVGRGGEIQVSRGSAIADDLEDAIDRGHEITVVPT